MMVLQPYVVRKEELIFSTRVIQLHSFSATYVAMYLLKLNVLLINGILQFLV